MIRDAQVTMELFEKPVTRVKAKKQTKGMNTFMKKLTKEWLGNKLEDIEDALKPSKMFLVCTIEKGDQSLQGGD